MNAVRTKYLYTHTTRAKFNQSYNILCVRCGVCVLTKTTVPYERRVFMLSYTIVTY